jgi:uncharacterized Zn-binding protein involved in type VI secretion
MNLPVARIGDLSVCPICDPKPHVGGPIIGPGCPTVLIENLPIALLGDRCTCVGPPASVSAGSSTVKVADKSPAYLGSQTSHGGTIATGAMTVLCGQ